MFFLRGYVSKWPFFSILFLCVLTFLFISVSVPIKKGLTRDYYYETEIKRNMMGKQFDKYRNSILNKMKRLKQETSSKVFSDCVHPLYTGEFGMELTVNVPWAYYKSRRCHVYTSGVPGTKYMYFFSYNHTIINKKRSNQLLPSGNPFRSKKIHMNDFPYDTEWLAPPFKDFFIQPEIYKILKKKPLVVITNKYYVQWNKFQHKTPQNFMSVDLLKNILLYLTPRYTILYKRHTSSKLSDHDDRKNDDKHTDLGFHDKEMIREDFPNVILYEDLGAGLTDVEDENLLLFGVMSLSDRFLSIQGGSAAVSSYFGGNTTIMDCYSFELYGGDYNYFHRFSNSRIDWTNRHENKSYIKHHGLPYSPYSPSRQMKTEKEFLALVRERL